jgi:CheY-like chemotaxis protein
MRFPTHHPRSLPAVLVVDDEPEVLQSLCADLAYCGSQVIAASSGTEAVTLLRTYSQVIAVALIDLNMPEVDGLATLQALLQIKPDLPCWIMSEDIVSQEEGIPLCGIAGVLGKPIVLRDMIRALLKLPVVQRAKTISIQGPSASRPFFSSGALGQRC